MTGADLTDGRFANAVLTGASFTNARLDRARDLLLPN
ncbi:pentapeptide repeat-containing protein [Ferrovibrio sp.]